MNTTRATLGLMLCIAVSLVLATPAFAGGVVVTGKVVGDNGAEEVPLANVRIDITPLGPVMGKRVAPVDDLVGVATTTPLGKFRIGELSSPSEGTEHVLLKNWRYRINIQAAGHYLFDQEIEVRGRSTALDFVVKSRDYAVLDETGPVGENQTLSKGGAVRKGDG